MIVAAEYDACVWDESDANELVVMMASCGDKGWEGDLKALCPLWIRWCR